MALASWLAAIVGILVIISGAVLDAFRGSHSFVSPVLGLVVFVSGIILGIVALIGIGRYGKKKILWPAIIGICLNVPLIVFGLTSVLFVAVSNVHVRLEPAVHAASAHLLKDERLQFSMDIPENFQEYPDAKAHPNDEYAYISRSEDKKTAYIFIIQSQDFLLPRTYGVGQLEPDFKGEIVHPTWRGVTINATIETAVKGEFTLVTYDILVPLRPKAIRLMVYESGPNAKRSEAEALADKLLSSLEGETNW